MPDWLTVSSAAAVGWLLTYLLHSTVLIGGAWALSRVLTLQPGTRDFLWRLALLGGIVTATAVVWSTPAFPEDLAIEVKHSTDVELLFDPEGMAVLAWSSLEPEFETILRERTVETGSATLRLRAAGAPTPECDALLRAGAPREPGWIEKVDELCAAGARIEWYHGLILVWLGGAGIGLGVFMRSRRALYDLRASLDEAGPRPRALLEELRGDRGSIRVMSSPALTAPCVLSGRTIGLPNRCEEELTDAELRAVLAHEMAHIVRRDPLWLGFFRIVLALLWVQPLNRLALSCVLEAAELTCDDWALARTGERFGLAHSISRVAEWASAGQRHPAIVSMAGRDRGTASMRVRRILLGHHRTEPFWLRGLAAVAIATPLLFLPAVPVPSGHWSFFLDETHLIGPISDLGGVATGAARQRIFIARLQSG